MGSPNQSRDPKGTPTGGQWTKGGGAASVLGDPNRGGIMGRAGFEEPISLSSLDKGSRERVVDIQRMAVRKGAKAPIVEVGKLKDRRTMNQESGKWYARITSATGGSMRGVGESVGGAIGTLSRRVDSLRAFPDVPID